MSMISIEFCEAGIYHADEGEDGFADGRRVIDAQ